jgi:hypothetical protein
LPTNEKRLQREDNFLDDACILVSFASPLNKEVAVMISTCGFVPSDLFLVISKFDNDDEALVGLILLARATWKRLVDSKSTIIPKMHTEDE